MTGTLGLFSLVDLFQLLAASSRSGRLTVDHPAGPARVYFEEGLAVHAEFAGFTGEEAVYELFSNEQGSFEFMLGVPAPRNTIEAGTENLVLEATRRLDESRRGDSPPRAEMQRSSEGQPSSALPETPAGNDVTRMGQVRPGHNAPPAPRTGELRQSDDAGMSGSGPQPQDPRQTGRQGVGPREVGPRETGRHEARSNEGGRHEGDRFESGRLQSGRDESGRLESGRLESGRLESGRLESGRDESGRHESGRLESGPSETPRRVTLTAVPAFGETGSSVGDMSLSKAEVSLLRCVDGKRSLAAIANEANVSPQEAESAVARLLDVGILRLAPRKPRTARLVTQLTSVKLPHGIVGVDPSIMSSWERSLGYETQSVACRLEDGRVCLLGAIPFERAGPFLMINRETLVHADLAVNQPLLVRPIPQSDS
ncbi:MAG: DUF4388 domain-containing protein [Trueperaceae bacterium]